MKCKEAQVQISMQMDGELSPREEQALEMHLHLCPRCSGVRSEMISLQQTMALWGDEEPSPVLAQSFAARLARIDEAPRRAIPPKLHWTFTTAAATAVVIAIFALLLYSRPAGLPGVNAPFQSMSAKTLQPAPRPGVAPYSQTMPEPEEEDQVAEVPDTAQPRDAGSEEAVRPETVSRSQEMASAPGPGRVVRVRRVPRATPRASEERPIQVAYNPYRLQHELTSRSGSRMKDQETLVKMRITRALALEDHTSKMVSARLAADGMAMNETMERVRGVMQEAVDHLAVRTEVQPEQPASPGGSEL